MNQVPKEEQTIQEKAALGAPRSQSVEAPVERNGITEPKQQVEPAKPIQIPKEEILVKAYKEVQNGKITDPEAIRTIAAIFEAVARDSQASPSVSFDAEHAAKELYKKAHQ